MPVYTWHGENPKGAVCGGKITREAAALPAFVRDRFERGWRHLTVTRGGAEVASICRDPDQPRRRIWWAETAG